MADLPPIEKIIKELRRLFKEVAEKTPTNVQGFIGRELGESKLSAGYAGGGAAFPSSEETFNTTKKLRLKTGKLFRSFNEKDINTLTKTEVKGDKVKITIGSKLPYARIHETGGFIKATPVKSKRRKTFKMAQYFWAKYLDKNDGGNIFHKIMALSVQKKGGVDIPKRPYFKPALKAFEKKGMKILIENAVKKLIRFIG